MSYTGCKSVILCPASILCGAREYHCAAGVKSARTAAGYSPALSAAAAQRRPWRLSCQPTHGPDHGVVEVDCATFSFTPWGLLGKGYALAGMNSNR